MMLYVNDLLITGNDLDLIHDMKHRLNARYKMKDLGSMQCYLGVEFHRSSHGFLLH